MAGLERELSLHRRRARVRWIYLLYHRDRDRCTEPVRRSRFEGSTVQGSPFARLTPAPDRSNSEPSHREPSNTEPVRRSRFEGSTVQGSPFARLTPAPDRSNSEPSHSEPSNTEPVRRSRFEGSTVQGSPF